MKILYFEREISGHRLPHLSSIIHGNGAESVIVCSEAISSINCRQYVLKNVESKKRSLKSFLKMLNEIKKICKNENPDIVHFTDGNIFYRYFGIGLRKFKKYKTVLTNHNAEEDFLHCLSARLIAHKVSIVTVTSEYSKTVFERCGAKNVVNIEYPQLNDLIFDKKESMEYFGIKTSAPIISCIGGTRFDKGLDIILEALKKVDCPFHLLIAGRAEFFTESYIDQEIVSFKDNVTKVLRFLSDQELAMALSCSDFIAVPYRKGFNGASGPLEEGVWRDKCIIGPKSKNLGEIIERHHLGYTFEQENPISLALLLNNVLKNKFLIDDKYEAYKSIINHNSFEQSYRKLYISVLTTKGK